MVGLPAVSNETQTGAEFSFHQDLLADSELTSVWELKGNGSLSETELRGNNECAAAADITVSSPVKPSQISSMKNRMEILLHAANKAPANVQIK